MFTTQKNSMGYYDGLKNGRYYMSTVAEQSSVIYSIGDTIMGGTKTYAAGDTLGIVANLKGHASQGYVVEVNSKNGIVFSQEYTEDGELFIDIPVEAEAVYYQVTIAQKDSINKYVIGNPIFVTATNAIVVFTVQFVDYDGLILSEQTVEEGNSATAPANPAREGYTFTGWDADFSYITGNLTITALYEVNKTIPIISSYTAKPSSTNLQNSTTVTITVTGHYSDGSSATLASASVKLKQNGTQSVNVGGYGVTVVVNGNNKITDCYVGIPTNNGGNQNGNSQGGNSQGGNSKGNQQ